MPAATRVFRYGDHPSQFAELTVPAGPPRGVVVVIHGGFWRSAYDLELGRPLAVDLARHGWAAWNLEYRRVGDDGGAPATFDDVAAGIEALADAGLERDGRVVTLGHSAGGHLATWAAARGDHGWPARVAITGVVSQAGVLDLAAAAAAGLGSGAVEEFLGEGPRDARVDPIQQIPLAVPVRCVHAPDDDRVPISQSLDYVDAARAVGADAALVAVAGGHFAMIEVASAAWADCLGAVAEVARG